MNYQQAFADHYKAVRARIENAKMRASLPKLDRCLSEDLTPSERPPKPLIEPDPRREILRHCATEYGCTVADMMSENRVTHVMLARRKAMWLLHKRGTMSKAAIGRYFNKDHTTVIHAVRAYEKSLAQGEAK